MVQEPYIVKLEMKAVSGSWTLNETSFDTSAELKKTLVIVVRAYLETITESTWNRSYISSSPLNAAILTTRKNSIFLTISLRSTLGNRDAIA